MKNLFWIVVIFVAAVLLAFGAQKSSGSVIFLLAQHRVEISFNFFIILSLLAFFVLFLLWRIFSMIFGIPEAVRQFQDRRAQKTFNQSLLAFFEGQFNESLKLAQKTYKKNKWKGLSALLAAHCAHELNNQALQEQWLENARQTDEELNHAVTLLKAQNALKQAHFDAVLDQLTQLPPKLAGSPYALSLDLSARRGLKEGEGILSRLKLLQKKGVLSAESAQIVKDEATLNALNEARTNLEKLKQFLSTWKAGNAQQAQIAVDALLQHNDEKTAQKWIEKYLADPEHLKDAVTLFARYAALTEGDEKNRIAQAEKWLAQTPNNSALLLALGQMCLKEELWGKAQNYLEAAIALNQNLEAHLELAHLLDHLHRPEDANKHYRALAQTDFKEKQNVTQNL